MNKDIYNNFVKIEGEWKRKIIELYNKYFSEFKDDYKKVAELYVVINNRADYYLEGDENLYFTYLDLSSRTLGWSNEKLNDEDYYEFCKLADAYSILKESSK